MVPLVTREPWLFSAANGTIGANVTIGRTVGTNGTIGSPNGTIGIPMVPLVSPTALTVI